MRAVFACAHLLRARPKCFIPSAQEVSRSVYHRSGCCFSLSLSFNWCCTKFISFICVVTYVSCVYIIMNIFANLTANNLQSIQNGTRNLSLSLSLLPVAIAIAIATLSSVRCFSVFISISICDLYVCLRRCRSVCLFVCCFSSFHLYKSTHPYTQRMCFQCLSSQIFYWHHMPPRWKKTFHRCRRSLLFGIRIIILFIWFGLVLFRIYCYIFILVVRLVWLRLSDSSLLVEFHLDFRKYNMLFWFISVSMKWILNNAQSQARDFGWWIDSPREFMHCATTMEENGIINGIVRGYDEWNKKNACVYQ